MIRDPRCDNNACDYDNGRWIHAPECRVGADTGDSYWGEDMALTTAHEDGYTSVFVPAQQDRRAAA